MSDPRSDPDRQAYEILSLLEPIVRELAERGPFSADDGLSCLFCENRHYLHLDDLANHEPSCLWRRAKALYPGGATAERIGGTTSDS